MEGLGPSIDTPDPPLLPSADGAHFVRSRGSRAKGDALQGPVETTDLRSAGAGPLFGLLLTGALVIGCGGGQPPAAPEPEAEADARAEGPGYRPDDYVVLVDNSASIRGEQKTILREAIQVLADIALPGDRIAIVTFDSGARLLQPVVDIQGEADRRTLRELVEAQVDFTGSHSNMTAGFELVAQRKDELFRSGAATPNLVILSDGLLEPAGGDAGAALDRLADIASRDLGNCAVYPIGIGDTQIHKPIAAGRPETGAILMGEMLTARGGQYFWARTFDMVHPSMLRLFRVTKGLGEIADESGEPGAFFADQYIQRVIVVVPKRDEAGEVLATTRDVTLDAPDKPGLSPTSGQTPLGEASATRMVWNSSYRFFDLITLENPEPGRWTVNAPPTAQAGLVVLPITRVRIVTPSLASFYADERRTVAAWIQDEEAGTRVERPLEASLLVRQTGQGATQKTAGLRRDGDRYLLGLGELAALDLAAGQEYEARYLFRGDDPPFLRQTSWSPLQLLPPLIVPAEAANPALVPGGGAQLVNAQPWPLGSTAALPLMASVDTTRADYASRFGGVAPRFQVEVLQASEETEEAEVLTTVDLAPDQQATTVTYAGNVDLPPGAYTLVYRAEGTDSGGNATSLILLPRTAVFRDYGPVLTLVILGILFGIVCAAVRRARLKMGGSLTVTIYERDDSSGDDDWLRDRKVTVPLAARRGARAIPGDEPAATRLKHGPAFVLTKDISLYCFGKAVYRLKPLQGTLRLKQPKMTVTDPRGQKITASARFDCTEGDHRYTVNAVLT